MDPKQIGELVMAAYMEGICTGETYGSEDAEGCWAESDAWAALCEVGIPIPEVT